MSVKTSLEGRIADLQTRLQQEQQGKPTAYIGFPKITLTTTPRMVEINIEEHNYGTVSAEEVTTVASAVLGDGPSSQMVSIALSPSIRFLPTEEHHIVMQARAPKGQEKKFNADFLSLIRYHRPLVVTLNLYFKANAIQYSQHTVFYYNYEIRRWIPAAQQVLGGFVAMPGAVYKGTAIYWAASWLPPIPPTISAGSACTVVPAKSIP